MYLIDNYVMSCVVQTVQKYKAIHDIIDSFVLLLKRQ